MAEILQTAIFKGISMYERSRIFNKIALNYICKCLIDTAVDIGSSCGLVPSGSKPLPDPMMTQFQDAICRHYDSMS